MSTFGFKRIPPPPPPPPRKMCLACKAFAAEVEVPIGDGAAPMCWMCAHLHVDHDVPIHETLTSEACGCTPDKVYPDRCGDGLLLNGHMHDSPISYKHGDLTYEQIQKGLQEQGEIAHLYNHKTREIERVVIPLRRRN